MHAIIPPPSFVSLAVINPWSVGPADLERLATALLGPLPGGWVRRGDNFIRVGNVKYGADARKLDAELTALSTGTKRILAATLPESALRAAAFYHLRFENIHPLCEANGRIGRVLLAAQLEHALRFPLVETLTGFRDWEADYQRLFATNVPPLMFELLLDLLCRITGIEVPPGAAQLPGQLEPLHPQKHMPKHAARLHPEQALANPSLVKSFARAARPPGRPNPFCKFG